MTEIKENVPTSSTYFETLYIFLFEILSDPGSFIVNEKAIFVYTHLNLRLPVIIIFQFER